jgi:hypothetical protein
LPLATIMTGVAVATYGSPLVGSADNVARPIKAIDPLHEAVLRHEIRHPR